MRPGRLTGRPTPLTSLSDLGWDLQMPRQRGLEPRVSAEGVQVE